MWLPRCYTFFILFRVVSSSLEDVFPSMLSRLLLTSWHHADPLRLDPLAATSSETSWRILERQIPGCQFVVLTKDKENVLVRNIIRKSFRWSQPLVLISSSDWKEPDSKEELQIFWGDSTTTCRVLLMDLTSKDNGDLMRILEFLEIWRWPETKILAVGETGHMSSLFSHESLRNSLQPLYLSISSAHNTLRSSGDASLRNRTEKESSVSIYSRCLFCDQGKPKVQLLSSLLTRQSISSLYKEYDELMMTFQGHLMKYVSASFFPYIDYTVDSNQTASTVTLLDSMDTRCIQSLSSHLNFTYEVRQSRDLQFGIPLANGTWTGLIGTVIRGEADITTTIASNLERMQVLNHVRVCPADTIALISLKPQLLPQYLVIIRPFTGVVWMSLVFTIVAWGISLWFLQKAHSHLTKDSKRMDLNTAIFYGWAVILEDPPCNTPSHITGQMLVGWWLVFCLLISTYFRSSLVAHLTVQSKSKPIDSFQDMVAQGNWEWALAAELMKGAPMLYFKQSTDPLLQKVYKRLQAASVTEALDRILKGRFSFLSATTRTVAIIDSYHTDKFGRTPYHIGKTEYNIFNDFGWGFRKGSPYQRRLSQLLNRLTDGGIVNYWLKYVMNNRVRETRKQIHTQEHNSLQNMEINLLKEDDKITLKLNHMMGVFMVVLLGYGISLLAFLGEQIVHRKQEITT